jgi:ferritin-like metal-binding protein YciE
MPGLKTLEDLFEDELKDVYDAEKQILKALPKIIEAASDVGLREALIMHREETENQVKRLDQVFESIDVKPSGKHCAGMAGILEEGNDLLKEEDGDEGVLDAAFIAACQRVEHYEITAYGTLIAWAELLRYEDAVGLLEANEREEKAADMKLSEIAESVVNPLAAAGGDGDEGNEEEDEEEDATPAATGSHSKKSAPKSAKK